MRVCLIKSSLKAYVECTHPDTIRSGFGLAGKVMVNGKLLIHSNAVLKRTNHEGSLTKFLTPPRRCSLESVELTSPRKLLFLEKAKHGDMNGVEIIASVRDMADLKSNEALERHNANPQELPWSNNSLLYSEDPTIELDTESVNGRTNIVPEITEEKPSEKCSRRGSRLRPQH